MLRNLMVNWLLLVEEQLKKNRCEGRRDAFFFVGEKLVDLFSKYLFLMLILFHWTVLSGAQLKSMKHRFCGQNAVNEKRFNAFEHLVGDLAAYAADMAPEGYY